MTYEYYKLLCVLRTNHTPLPIQKNVALQLEEKNINWVPHSLIALINTDPLCTTASLIFAHQQLAKRTEKITTLDKAIMLIGVEKMTAYLLRSPRIDLPQLYQRDAERCITMARTLGEIRFDINPQELQLAASLYWTAILLLSSQNTPILPPQVHADISAPWLSNMIELIGFISNFWNMPIEYTHLFHPNGLKNSPRTQTLGYAILVNELIRCQQMMPDTLEEEIAHTLRIPVDKCHQIMTRCQHHPK